MSKQAAAPRSVLFLCTGNSARSIMAEALMRKLGGATFEAYSAGSHPTGRVNPFAVQTLQRMRIPVEGLRSKSWDEFARLGAPSIDFVFIVCDRAAAETCPVWPGRPITAHWGVEDPASYKGSEEEVRQAFYRAALVLRRRIELFLALPLDKLETAILRHRLRAIGAV